MYIFVIFQLYTLKSQGPSIISRIFDLPEVTQETCNTGEKDSLY